MIKNYITSAIRNISRFKLHSAINIGGLAISISIFSLIIIYVESEFSYDQYHEHYDKIYQVRVYNELHTTAHLGYILKEAYPEIKYLVRTDQWYGGGRKAYLQPLNTDNLIEFEDIIYSDPDFFSLFSVKSLSGDLSTALLDPYSIVLTESSALRLFGSIDVVSKSIGFLSENGSVQSDFTITAVIEDVPRNSSVKYSAIASFITLNDIKPGGIEVDQDYYNWGYPTFIMLHDLADASDFKENIQDAYVNVMSEIIDFDPLSEEADEYRMGLIPLSEVPFFGNNKRQFLSLIVLIGVFIIVIAMINFVNLSLAKSSLRSKEIGYRKAVGASRKNLIGQFIGETTAMVIISVIISMILTEVFKPVFNTIVGKELSIGYIDHPKILLFFLAGSVLLGVLAGFYPAIVLSRLNPAKTMNNEVTSGKKGTFLIQSLSVVQISIALTLIIGILVISKQINYMKTKDLGFKNTNIIYFPSNDHIHDQYESFKQRILESPAVYEISRAGNEFGDRFHITLDEEFNGVRKSFQAMVADPDFVETMGLEIVEGRNYDWNRASDIGGMIINETAAIEFGMDSIIGHRLSTLGSQQEIVGIFRDIHTESFHHKITPSALINYPYMLNTVIIKINGNNSEAAINHVVKVWKETIPDVPFKYDFLEDKYDKLYEAETKFGMVIVISALFSVLIACLGLFGLVSHNSERRKKEIGIRKSNGASIANILILLNTGILKWVGTACIIAIPLSYFATDKWLQDFAYRTPLSIGVIVLAIFIVLAISFLAVTSVVLKAAKTNPAECLRTE